MYFNYISLYIHFLCIIEIHIFSVFNLLCKQELHRNMELGLRARVCRWSLFKNGIIVVENNVSLRHQNVTSDFKIRSWEKLSWVHTSNNFSNWPKMCPGWDLKPKPLANCNFSSNWAIWKTFQLTQYSQWILC